MKISPQHSTSTTSFICVSNTAPAVVNLGKQYFRPNPEPSRLKKFSNLVISPHPEYTAQLKHNPLHFKDLPFRVTSGEKNREEEKLKVVRAKPLFNERKRKKKKVKMAQYGQAIFLNSCEWQIDDQPQMFIVHLNVPALRNMWVQLKGV